MSRRGWPMEATGVRLDERTGEWWPNDDRGGVVDLVLASGAVLQLPRDADIIGEWTSECTCDDDEWCTCDTEYTIHVPEGPSVACARHIASGHYFDLDVNALSDAIVEGLAVATACTTCWATHPGDVS